MGGMEAHCYRLVKALRDRGHRVVLFAAGRTDLPGSVSICPQPYEHVLPWDQWRGTDALRAYQDRAFGHAWDKVRTGAFDVVHNNSLYPDLIDWAAADAMPMVTSHHVPPFMAMREAVSNAAASASNQFTVTSRHQLSLWNGNARDRMHLVHNGIATEDWPVSDARGDRLIWFGRITENKGLREAVRAALLARVPLDIAGTIEDKAYFTFHVEPYLGDAIRYLGHLSGNTLKARVSQARAAVMTPLWDEPFGLVAAEAMASGVPVIAFDRGAMREVLGPCGRLVPPGDISALAHAMRNAALLDHRACRAHVAERFGMDRMLDGYERCYALAMAGGASADRAAPVARPSSTSSTVALLA